MNEIHIIVYNRPRDYAVFINGLCVATRFTSDAIQSFLDRNYPSADSVTWA